MKFLRFCVVKILIFTFKVSKNPIFHQISFTLIVAIAKSLQSCLTLCDPIDGSPPGSPIPGILQARTLEWVAISFSSLEKAEPSKGTAGIFTVVFDKEDLVLEVSPGQTSDAKKEKAH